MTDDNPLSGDVSHVIAYLIRLSKLVTKPYGLGFMVMRRDNDDGSIEYQIFADTKGSGRQIAYVQSSRHDAEFIAACFAQAPLFEALLRDRPALSGEETPHEYLSRLLRSHAPDCEPLPDLMGVISQIDNLLCGYRKDPPALSGAGQTVIAEWQPIETAPKEFIVSEFMKSDMERYNMLVVEGHVVMNIPDVVDRDLTIKYTLENVPTYLLTLEMFGQLTINGVTTYQSRPFQIDADGVADVSFPTPIRGGRYGVRFVTTNGRLVEFHPSDQWPSHRVVKI